MKEMVKIHIRSYAAAIKDNEIALVKKQEVDIKGPGVK